MAGFSAAFIAQGAAQDLFSQPIMVVVNVGLFSIFGLVQWQVTRRVCARSRLSLLCVRAIVSGFLVAFLVVSMDSVISIFETFGLITFGAVDSLPGYALYGLVLIVTSMAELFLAILFRKRDNHSIHRRTT